MDIKLGAAVPKPIWDALVSVLNTKMLGLAKEIADTLEVPVEPLKVALKAEMLRPYVVNYADESRCTDMRCGYICQRPEAPLFLQACGQPVFWGGTPETSVLCPQHMYMRPEPVRTLPKLEAVRVDEERLLYMAEDGTLYDANYTPKGRINLVTKKITLFSVA